MNGRGVFLLEVLVAIGIVWFFFEEMKKRGLASASASGGAGGSAGAGGSSGGGASSGGCGCRGGSGAGAVVPSYASPPTSFENAQPPPLAPVQVKKVYGGLSTVGVPNPVQTGIGF